MSLVLRSTFAAMLLVTGFGLHAADKADGGKLSKSDRNFITEAAHGGHAEVELGKMAQQNGGSQEVKSFGERMVQDHGKANEELAAIAKNHGVTPPMEPNAKQRADAKRLAKLKGAEFDRAYADLMVKDHQKTIALFEKEAKSGGQEELKAFASKTLPVLQEHHKMAQGLQPARNNASRK